MKNYILYSKQFINYSFTGFLTNVRFQKKKLLFLISFLIIGFNSLFSQVFLDARTYGGTGTDVVTSIAIDEESNQYITGVFNQTMIINDTLISNGQDDIFIFKKNKQNEILWTQSFGSSSDEQSTKVVYQDGFIYTTGFFWDNILVDTIALSVGTGGGSALYVAKWDTLGQVQWAQTIKGAGIKSAESLAIGKDNKVYIIGYFDQSLIPNSTAISGNGTVNSFLSEYDSSGNFINFSVYGETSETRFRDIQIDTSGNLYILGEFDGQVNFGGNSLTSGANDLNAFLLKISPQNTNNNWIKHLSGVGDVFPQKVVLDNNQNVYTIGYYINSLNFEGQQFIQTASNDHDVFIGKYRTNGDFVAAKSLGGADNEFATAANFLGENLIIGGHFIGNAVLDSSTLAGNPLIPRGFVMHMDTVNFSGYASAIGDVGFNTFVADIGFNAFSAFCCQAHWVIGNFSGQFPVSLSPQYSAPSQGSFDFFIGLNTIAVLINIHQKKKLFSQIFPNPATDFLNIKIETDDYQITITNALGQVVFTKNEYVNEAIRIPVSGLENGLFFIKMAGQKGQVTRAFVIQR